MNAVLVSGDFVRTGGMDRANLALASYLARSDPSGTVDVVAHRIDPELRSLSNIRVHRAPKPLNSYLLGAAALDRIGRRVAQRATDARVIVNGGNCNWADVNWVHYVHAAWKPSDLDAQPIFDRVKSRWRRNRSLADEAAIIPRSKLVIANSHRTKRDLIDRVGVAEVRIRVVYYGIDPGIFYPASDDEKRAIRDALNLPIARPLVAFVGSTIDRRKGFDVLSDAWTELCADPNWDADLIVIGAGAAGQHDRIHHLGFRDDVPKILRAVDAIVSPARYEAYGLAIHEAVCCGAAPIVTATAGIAERFSEALSPILLRDVTSDELAIRLRMWQDYPAHWREITRAITDDWRKRTWDDMSAEITERLLSPA